MPRLKQVYLPERMSKIKVHTARLKPFIEAAVEEENDPLRPEGARGGLARVAAATGVDVRILYRIVNQIQPNVTFDLADRIICGINVHYAMYPPEKGGFADFYDPDNCPAPAPETDEQREVREREAAYRRSRKLTGQRMSARVAA